MNIFVSSPCPYRSAFDLPDKLLIKMVLETAQLLSSAVQFFNRQIEDPDLKLANLYKESHTLEPVSIWAKKDIANLCWLLHHGLGLVYEYRIRYNKRHKSTTQIEESLKWYIRNFGLVRFAEDRGKHQEFTMMMPYKYRTENVPRSYKVYLQTEKSHYATWRIPGHRPKWWVAKCKQDSFRHRSEECLII